MDVESRHAALLAELAKDGVRLVPKAGVWHQRALHSLLKVVTLGGQSRYLHDYVTTIGRSIYLPPNFESRSIAERYATLRHERIHVKQFRRYGFIPMAVAYVLLPLPLGLAWFRAALEREAYAETIRATHELGGRAATDRLRAHVVRQFTGGAYGWMWPFKKSIESWFDRTVRDIELE